MISERIESIARRLEAAVQLHLAGRLAEAEQQYREILQHQPNDPDALHLLGVLAGQCKQTTDAISLINRAVTLRPNFPEALANLGRIYADAGDLENAIQCYRKAVQLSPLDGQVAFALGIVLRISGKIGEAQSHFSEAIRLDPLLGEAYYELGTIARMKGDTDTAVIMQRKAISLRPRMADAHNGLANAMVDRKEFEAAADSYRHAIELNPANLVFHRNLGSVLEQMNRFEEAMLCFDRVLQQDPRDLESLISRGRIQMDLRHYDAAHQSLRDVLQQSPSSHTAYQILGELYSETRDYASAETAFATVLELAPQSTNAWVGLGTVYKALGRFDEAAAAFRKALKISPDNVNALNHLTVVGRATDSDLAALTNQLAHGRLNDEDSIEAEFAIGKQLDDANRYNQAFAHYARGNMLAKQICRSEGRSFERATFESLVDQQIQTFNPDFFKRLLEGGNASETPVFIVGMPRSGTTLTEQILASHSKVFGAGELRDISNIAITTPDPKTWDSMTIRHQAESHLRRLVERAPGSERVVDKMPGNIFHLGLIGALFPNARVIFCRRDPRDNCLSCYFQWFSDNGFSFSYDLADCGTQWKAQERLEKHFLQNLPLRMTVVQYETLVADLEGESRRLIDFLGLEWESQCLEFHKTKRSVSTASVWQVRQPLYSSSVGRWKHYEKHLGPLLTELAK